MGGHGPPVPTPMLALVPDVVIQPHTAHLRVAPTSDALTGSMGGLKRNTLKFTSTLEVFI